MDVICKSDYPVVADWNNNGFMGIYTAYLTIKRL